MSPRRQDRPVEWGGRMFQDIPLPLAGQTKVVIIDADEAGPNPFSFEHYTRPTIVRVRGKLITQLRAPTSDRTENFEYRYAVGLLLQDEDTPPESIPGSMGHSWMWLDYGMLHRPPVATVASGAGDVIGLVAGDDLTQVYGTPLFEHTIDTKGMRIVNRDQELRLVFQFHAAVGAPLPVVHGLVRALIKE